MRNENQDTKTDETPRKKEKEKGTEQKKREINQSRQPGRRSMGFNRFCWVLLGLTGFDWV